jgi:hypothetical protein
MRARTIDTMSARPSATMRSASSNVMIRPTTIVGLVSPAVIGAFDVISLANGSSIGARSL